MAGVEAGPVRGSVQARSWCHRTRRGRARPRGDDVQRRRSGRGCGSGSTRCGRSRRRRRRGRPRARRPGSATSGANEAGTRPASSWAWSSTTSRVAGVGAGDPDERDAGIPRRRPDRPRCAPRGRRRRGAGRAGRCTLLDAADDRRRGVVEEGDRQARRAGPPLSPRRSTRGAGRRAAAPARRTRSGAGPARSSTSAHSAAMSGRSIRRRAASDRRGRGCSRRTRRRGSRGA